MFGAIVLGLAVSQAGRGPEVTVYNQGFAFVKEDRTVQLKLGRQKVEVRDVPSMIETSSVGVRSVSDPGAFQLLEQNYQYDLIGVNAILEKSVGQPIRILRTIANQREVLEGTLLSAPTSIVSGPQGQSTQTYNGMVVRTNDGRIVLDPTGEIEVRAVPAGLISVPTLVWEIESSKAGPNQIELSYLTTGISWNADYVLTLTGDKLADLQGWVTINNQAGATWENARLKLLAGDVNRVVPRGRGAFAFGGGGGQAEAKAQFQEQSLFEYHLYTLQRPATIRNRETKQISLLEGKAIPFEKKLIVDSIASGFWGYYPGEGEIGTGPIHTQVRVEFTNDTASHLGMPLPGGNVKVYQRDSEGSAQMLGEAQIGHTPRNERISLPIGNSFDIVASRKRTNFTRVSSVEALESFQVEVRNRKSTAETVHVYERHWGDWTIKKKNEPFVKLDDHTVDFVLNLAPNEVKSVEYTVDTKW